MDTERQLREVERRLYELDDKVKRYEIYRTLNTQLFTIIKFLIVFHTIVIFLILLICSRA